MDASGTEWIQKSATLSEDALLANKEIKTKRRCTQEQAFYQKEMRPALHITVNIKKRVVSAPNQCTKKQRVILLSTGMGSRQRGTMDGTVSISFYRFL